MARGNTVELIFAGDDKQLQKTFDRVGAGSKDMADDVKRSSGEMRSGFDRTTEGADVFEQRTIGLRDSVTGTGDVMRGLAEGDMTLLLTGFADLASSVVNFAGPVLKGLLGRLATSKVGLLATAAASGVLSVATGVLNAVMALNPIVLVVASLALLTAGFIAAWKHSETFRNVVTGVMDKVKGVFSGVAGALSGPFKAAFNAIGSLWNNTVGKISFKVPGWVPGIGGKGFSVPKIPRLHTGGVVPGPLGTDQLALLQAGELVVPAGRRRGGAGMVVNINVAGSVISDRDLGRVVVDALRNNGLMGVAA